MKQGEIWLINLDPFKDSSSDCFQIRSVSQERFMSKIGKVSDSVFDEIKIGLTKLLSMESLTPH